MTAHPLVIQTQAEIARDSGEASEALDLIRNLSVHDQSSFAIASEICREVKARWKALDNRRKEITGPLTNAIRSVNALFAPVLGSLAEAEAVLKAKLAAHTAAEAQARTQAMETQAALHGAGVLAVVPMSAPPEAPGVNVRTVRRFEITDPDRVPRQFCSPDPERIRAHLEAGGLEAIPGVRFYDDQIVTVRQ